MGQPPKRARKILLRGAACAAAVTIAVLAINGRPKRESVTVAFIGYTNAFAGRTADEGWNLCLFRGTNDTRHTVKPSPMTWVTSVRPDRAARQRGLHWSGARTAKCRQARAAIQSPIQ